MPLEPLFQPFRSAIDEQFAEIKAEAGDKVSSVIVTIEEKPFRRGMVQAEIVVFDPAGPVRITWNAIASLWALGQGAARLSRRMFEAKRAGVAQLSLDDPEVERGYNSFVLARRFFTDDIPLKDASPDKWPTWAPPIDPVPSTDSDDAIGLRFFFGALRWILRHELAHVALAHATRQSSEKLTDQECEIEADAEATRRHIGEVDADAERPLGARPSSNELLLEGRAVSVGLGLIWVAMFEGDIGRSTKHPPTAERLFACFEEIGLREDSAAAEILSDIIQALIDPQGMWAALGMYPTAQAALSTAIIELHRHVMSQPKNQPSAVIEIQSGS